jgi:hypothetical protein
MAMVGMPIGDLSVCNRRVMQPEPRGQIVEPPPTAREVEEMQRVAGETYDEIARPRDFPIPKDKE